MERGALTRQAMDLNVKEGVVIVESRTTSSERKREASAEKQTSDDATIANRAGGVCGI